MRQKNVKITKSTNRRVEGRKEPYYKYIVTIPGKHLKELEWDEKTRLNMKVTGKKLVIEKE